MDDYYADEEGYAVWSTTQKVGDVTYLFGNDGTRVKRQVSRLLLMKTM